MGSPQTWVGTSWKMNKTLAEARTFVDVVTASPPPAGLQPFVLPPHTALAAVRDRLPDNSPYLLGAQNAHWGPEGAGTGEISMRMAKDAGARLIEMGHSERRESFGETDETVALKAAAALDHDLVPLICVGEPRSVREAGEAPTFIAAQVRAALSRVAAERIGQVIVAYEPIWAIGTAGQPATPEQIAPVMAVIAETVDGHGRGSAALALLYGGGVNADNAAAILGDPHTDGLFVGRAGWSPEGFLRLLDLAAAATGAGSSFVTN
ncbi:triose-phosphate isomerase [Nakamurella leprariae]|uniref:Triosephosphate isomerase n=1 Tax=Nakamurella leprariae TaxID=2803911 RepID=A0A938YAM9_9ACTN|nr:triose-phosphate isomerase [Nakamurella leprariae]MBM9468990.1 triose-phosphate isomerase [Nakamurella leprariae]